MEKPNQAGNDQRFRFEFKFPEKAPRDCDPRAYATWLQKEKRDGEKLAKQLNSDITYRSLWEGERGEARKKLKQAEHTKQHECHQEEAFYDQIRNFWNCYPCSYFCHGRDSRHAFDRYWYTGCIVRERRGGDPYHVHRDPADQDNQRACNAPAIFPDSIDTEELFRGKGTAAKPSKKRGKRKKKAEAGGNASLHSTFLEAVSIIMIGAQSRYNSVQSPEICRTNPSAEGSSAEISLGVIHGETGSVNCICEAVSPTHYTSGSPLSGSESSRPQETSITQLSKAKPSTMVAPQALAEEASSSTEPDKLKAGGNTEAQDRVDEGKQKSSGWKRTRQHRKMRRLQMGTGPGSKESDSRTEEKGNERFTCHSTNTTNTKTKPVLELTGTHEAEIHQESDSSTHEITAMTTCDVTTGRLQHTEIRGGRWEDSEDEEEARQYLDASLADFSQKTRDFTAGTMTDRKNSYIA